MSSFINGGKHYWHMEIYIYISLNLYLFMYVAGVCLKVYTHVYIHVVICSYRYMLRLKDRGGFKQ